MAFVNPVVTIDSAGRIVIPKAFREALHLMPGDALSIEADGDTITLKSRRSGSTLNKEQGIWVFQGGSRLSTEDTNRILENLRNDRDRRSRGSPS